MYCGIVGDLDLTLQQSQRLCCCPALCSAHARLRVVKTLTMTRLIHYHILLRFSKFTTVTFGFYPTGFIYPLSDYTYIPPFWHISFLLNTVEYYRVSCDLMLVRYHIVQRRGRRRKGVEHLRFSTAELYSSKSICIKFVNTQLSAADICLPRKSVRGPRGAAYSCLRQTVICGVQLSAVYNRPQRADICPRQLSGGNMSGGQLSAADKV